MERKRFLVTMTAAVLALLAFLLAGCNSRSGWGVVLWSLSDEGLPGGTVVKVLTESHINNMYIIETGNGEKRLEVPMWRLRKFKWKSQALDYAAAFAPYAPYYATAQRDGLPLRDHPDSGAKQVYKLREGQVIKIIERVEGVAVTSGSGPLSGDWYRVLTEDGTEGYCFSFTLTIFSEGDASTQANAPAGEPSVDPDLERFFSAQWRPEYFHEMLASGRIDLDAFSPDFGLFVDRTAKTVSLKLPKSSVAFGYTDVSKLENGGYRFEGAQFIVYPKADGSILAEYSERGTQKTALFVPFVGEPIEIIESEQARRSVIFAAIIKKGDVLRSSSFGTLSLSPDGSFSWKGFDALRPAVVPAEAGETGKAEIRIYLDDSLKSAYDGALSFAFDGAKGGAYVNFLYKLGATGIQFEFLPASCIEGITAMRRGDSPLVLFFAF
jgi:predicted small secreted protein